jgi:AraC family transcriptional regulator
MSDTHQTYRHRVLRVQLFIQEHLDEDLSVDRLAKLAHFSPFHFHRVFRALAGEGVHEYVRRLRLERAAVLLRSTGRDVTAIAFDAGYETHEAFTRAFRQHFGLAPSRYRAARSSGGPSEEETDMTTTATREVQVRTLPPLRVAFLRHVGPYPNVGETFGRLGAWAGPRGLIGPQTKMACVYHDDPEVTAPDKLRADCAITVGEEFRPEGEVGVQTLDGGDYAVLTHRGPYEGLAEAYRWLYGTWLPASGRELRDRPPFEVYLNTPADTPPEGLVTEIHLALA